MKDSRQKFVRLPAIWAAAHRGIYGALIVALLVVQLTAVYGSGHRLKDIRVQTL